MEPIITSFTSIDNSHHSLSKDGYDYEDEEVRPSSFYYKKINVPLAYPSEAIKEQFGTPKAYIYPPLMSPSDDFFSPNSPTSSSSLVSSQPINIPQGRSGGRRSSTAAAIGARSGSLPAMSQLFNNASQQERQQQKPQSQIPSPPSSPWKKRSNSFSKPMRSATLVMDETPYPDLPTDVRAWTSGHVAEYLGYSLRLYPRAITEDLGRYVRQTACITGAQFIDLTQDDLERMEINLKWRTMIMKAVGMLRRETVRASRIDTMNWEDGYDPEKDGNIPCPSSSSSSSLHETDTTHVQEHSIIIDTNISHSRAVMDSHTKEGSLVEGVDAQELRRGIVEDITAVLLSWKYEQETKAKKKTESSSSGLGFMEGVVIGGLIVAFMMRFSR
ncbi:hypothetical protein BGX28_003578 [Mortierella sp. GBA30]|nr:hypothetical protein BGX28_003578 [Mortierella sp. GBA30]